MSQSPRIINVQQNVAVQAPPKKTGGRGGRPPTSPEEIKCVRNVVIAGAVIMFLILLVSYINCKKLLFFANILFMFSQHCTLKEKFATRKNHLLLLTDKPSFSGSNHKTEFKQYLTNFKALQFIQLVKFQTGAKQSQAVLFMMTTRTVTVRKYIYKWRFNNKIPSVTIKSQFPNFNQISYQLHLLDVDSNCGDYLSIQGHDEQMCSLILVKTPCKFISDMFLDGAK